MELAFGAVLYHIESHCISEQTGAISLVLKQFRFAAGLKVGHRSTKILQLKNFDYNFQQAMSPELRIHNNMNT